MGYYTQIGLDLRVKPDKLAEFRVEWDKLVRTAEEQTPDKYGWVLYYNDLKVKDDGAIEFDEYSRKWYDPELFYDFIKGYVDKGWIEGQGEEFADVWRVEFDGKGNYREMDTIYVPISFDRSAEEKHCNNCGADFVICGKPGERGSKTDGIIEDEIRFCPYCGGVLI